MEEEHHTTHHVVHHAKKLTSNPWMISTVILAIALVFGAILYVSQGSGGASASTADVEKAVLKFADERGVNATVKSTTVKDSFYEVVLLINGQEAPLYVTKDGKYLVPQYVPLAETPAQIPDTTPPKATEVPKTDKPVVELYVFTYCPYGLQMEKAILPVVNLLGSKIDFKIRQIGAMHGEYEQIEAQRQLCIEKEYPSKYLTYVSEFAINTEIGSCSGDATCLKPKLEALMTKLGITGSKIDACMNSTGSVLYEAEVQNSQSKGVGGSPTTIINGVETQLSRSPDAIKTAICAAFTTAPTECSQTLSTAQASPGFGADAGSAGSAASCG